MEFMDIGTGMRSSELCSILTVKTELAEDTDRLFTLVEEVLEGFLTSVHVLKESKFIKLFVTESETINSWPNYQRLIAMLVEQLVLRSYVSHLEKEAARQMEQLLLEVSLENKSLSRRISTSCDKKRKNKKQKKRKAAYHWAPATDRVDLTPSSVDDEGGGNQMGNDPIATSTVEGVVMEPVFEPTPEFTSISVDSDCHPFVTTQPINEVTLGRDEVIYAEVENSTNKLSRLNPNALVFQPQNIESFADEFNVRSSYAGKRSFDQYVISVPWDDVNLDGGSIVDSQTVDSDSSSGDEDGNDRRALQRSRRKQRRREEDTELESQLQQVYASTSSLFGWDFLQQRELQDVNVHWSELMLWRTAPKEVVRYFSSDKRDTVSRFQAPQLLAPARPVPSRYYFNMQPSLPFGPPLSVPPARMEVPLYGTPFDYPLPDVVSSPDFSSMQYLHPSDQDDQT
uniref:Uncharacterized protein n=1 Tax=Hyaloperonospora arabidopsidis (strain Emoy2) TaxID=559515 RepID=M4BTB6_HYAAE